jgi:hypothetical protein
VALKRSKSQQYWVLSLQQSEWHHLNTKQFSLLVLVRVNLLARSLKEQLSAHTAVTIAVPDIPYSRS